ncbi:hypothetical protein BY458DRAFT_589371 [Sporodiniella umbellata]|nr:hypothetical protein BY458DRAFT_589371 [Sporodiniella umbellata]
MLAKSSNYKLVCRQHEIEGPVSPEYYLEWKKSVNIWRKEQQEKRKKTSTGHDVPSVQWAQKSYIQSNVMLHDLHLFDLSQNKYTPLKLLEDIKQRYGLIDSIVIWPSFPNLGCDSRNQEDYFRSLPGGISGLKELVKKFHKRNIKVIFPVIEWDNGTRDPQGAWGYILPRLLKEFNADGMSANIAYFTQDFWMNSLAISHPLALHSQVSAKADSTDSYDALQWNVMDTVQYETNLRIPTVSTRKLVEPRHMTHSSSKWIRNKTSIIQHAFFNGIGIDIWENIFGTWNQLSPRDAQALRSIASIFRCFGPNFLNSPEWEPHYPCIKQNIVFSSCFPSVIHIDQFLWTFVNRTPTSLHGRQITVNYHMGMQFYDVWHGQEIYPVDVVDGQATLAFDIEPMGYGCIFATSDVSPLPYHLDSLLKELNQHKISLTKVPLSSTVLWQELDKVVISVVQGCHSGMARIEGDDDYLFSVHSLDQVECHREYPAMDVRYPWEHQSSSMHSPYRVKIKPFYMDVYPVTESQFKDFLDSSSYKPKDPTGFLKHWINGCYPSSRANKPVVHVSLEDARAYAKWAGKRLPHEWEWQYVAQCGTEYREYPWGQHWDESKVPKPYEGRERLYPDHPPADVDAYPLGRSPFGIYDLVANVWQWTDVYQDQHTRAAIIRGGSYYNPKDGKYFAQAYRNNEHGKYLLMADSVDRSATIGFRCVKDTQESAKALGNCSFFEE